MRCLCQVPLPGQTGRSAPRPLGRPANASDLFPTAMEEMMGRPLQLRGAG